jgi:hypothetical protein
MFPVFFLVGIHGMYTGNKIDIFHLLSFIH